MAGNDIKQRIVLEGEQEYNKALKDAQRNLKVLRSELKAETAELGKNATEAQKNEAKVKNLTKQISEQEEIVKTYEKALEEVRQKYGDNEDAVAKWEIKLNNARTALANMRSELTQTGSGLESVGEGAQKSTVETYALAESLENIASVSESMSSTMESVFGSVVNTIRQTITAVWGELMEIAGKADNYADLGAFLGADATEVQKWDRAMKAAGGSLSTVTSMISRLKYGGKADKVTEWFGISGENYANDLEYAEQVFRKMAQDKEKMVAAGTWDEAMGEIFGAKKVQEIDGILSDWEQIEKGLLTFDVNNGGVGLTGEELQTMSDLYNEVGLLQEKWNAFKESVTTKLFGKIALDLTSNAQGALDALIELMDAKTAEEKEAAIEKFKENITEAFKKIGEALQAAAEALDEVGTELQGSENGYVRLLGDVLKGLSDAMEWLTKEGSLEQVLNFFRSLFDLWLGAKALTAVSRIGNLVTSFSNLKNMGWGSALLGGAGNSAAGGAASSAASGASSAASGAASSAGSSAATGTAGGFFSRMFGSAKTFLSNAANTAVFAAPFVLFADTLSHDLGMLNEMTEKGKQELAEYEAKNEQYAGSGMYSEWKVLSDYMTLGGGAAGEDHANMQAFAKSWLEFMDDADSDKYQGLFDLLWDADMLDDFNESMNSLVNGDTFYSDEERQAFLEPLQNVLQLLESELNREGFEGDLPANWWETFGNDENDLTKEDISGFMELPNKMSASVAGAVGNISVNLDGYKVGQLVAPYVSEVVARDIV